MAGRCHGAPACWLPALGSSATDAPPTTARIATPDSMPSPSPPALVLLWLLPLSLLLLGAAGALNVSRPVAWGGVEPPHKPQPTDEHTKRMHGAARPIVARCEDGQLEGHDCWRVYLALDIRAASSVYQLFGRKESPLRVFTTDGSPIFQAPSFGVDIGGVSPALYDHSPPSRYDSWLTIGSDDSTGTQQLIWQALPPFKESLLAPNGQLHAKSPFDVPPSRIPYDPNDNRSRWTTTLPLGPHEDRRHIVLVAQLSVKAGAEFVVQLHAKGKVNQAYMVGYDEWIEEGICATNSPASVEEHCATHSWEFDHPAGLDHVTDIIHPQDPDWANGLEDHGDEDSDAAIEDGEHEADQQEEGDWEESEEVPQEYGVAEPEEELPEEECDLCDMCMATKTPGLTEIYLRF